MAESILLVLGGLGLFLFGMKIMSEGLTKIAGVHLQVFLKKATSNRFTAVFVGTIATILMNNSTAVTVMTVGFVNAGLLNLMQAIGVVMGANIGTTFSAQLIAFRIDAYAPVLIFLGIIMYMFSKRKSVKNMGYAILGFGVLFFGISVMSGPLRALADLPGFSALLITFENPLLALLAGFAFTAVIQSSSASIGILLAMYIGGTPIPFETAAFIVLGINIGTCLTAVIASLPASRESKRVAFFHVTFNVVGAIVIGSLILIFPAILSWFENTWYEPVRQVAMFHSLFSIATLIILIPFVAQSAQLMEKLIPKKECEINNNYEKRLIYLDSKIEGNPSLAIFNAHLEICRMGKIANENITLALESLFEINEGKANKTLENEEVVNYLNHSITAKLVSINNMNLSDVEAKKLGEMFKTLSDLERIGDHAENIAEYTLMIKELDLKFSEVALKELKSISNLTIELITKTLEIYEKQDGTDVVHINALEKEVNKLAKELPENHIQRLKSEDCNPKSGVIFTNMIIDLERSCDHAKNVAYLMEAKIKEKKK